MNYDYCFGIRQHISELPATEALNRALNRGGLESCGKPRASRKCRIDSSQENMIDELTERKISFDMADLINATEPLEESIAFPKIEWTHDDEDESDHLQQVHMIPIPNNDEHELFHSSHSSPILGKRTRRSYHGRLVRSKSLKSSLCYLAEQGAPILQKCAAEANGGSWGQFVAHSPSEEDELLGKESLSSHSLCGIRASE